MELKVLRKVDFHSNKNQNRREWVMRRETSATYPSSDMFQISKKLNIYFMNCEILFLFLQVFSRRSSFFKDFSVFVFVSITVDFSKSLSVN